MGGRTRGWAGRRGAGGGGSGSGGRRLGRRQRAAGARRQGLPHLSVPPYHAPTNLCTTQLWTHHCFTTAAPPHSHITKTPHTGGPPHLVEGLPHVVHREHTSAKRAHNHDTTHSTTGGPGGPTWLKASPTLSTARMRSAPLDTATKPSGHCSEQNACWGARGAGRAGGRAGAVGLQGAAARRGVGGCRGAPAPGPPLPSALASRLTVIALPTRTPFVTHHPSAGRPAHRCVVKGLIAERHDLEAPHVAVPQPGAAAEREHRARAANGDGEQAGRARAEEALARVGELAWGEGGGDGERRGQVERCRGAHSAAAARQGGALGPSCARRGG